MSEKVDRRKLPMTPEKQAHMVKMREKAALARKRNAAISKKARLEKELQELEPPKADNTEPENNEADVEEDADDESDHNEPQPQQITAPKPTRPPLKKRAVVNHSFDQEDLHIAVDKALERRLNQEKRWKQKADLMYEHFQERKRRDKGISNPISTKEPEEQTPKQNTHEMNDYYRQVESIY